MTIKKRLDLIIKELGISGRTFEKECGLANGSYSSIRDGIGVDKLNKILFRFPQLSPEWLINGNGKMLRINNSELEHTAHVDSHSAVAEPIPSAAQSISTSNGAVDENEALKRIVFKLADAVENQQREISRLVAKIEENGQRTNQILNVLTENSEPKDSANPKKRILKLF